MNKNNNKNKKKTKPIDNTTSIYLRFLHKENGVSKAELARRYPQHAKRSVYRHASKAIIDPPPDQRQANRGRPKKLSAREERLIIKTLLRLRKEVASFTGKKIQEETGLTHVCPKTIQRVLHKNGYHYLHSRKKGLLTPKDKVRRLKWAKSMRHHDTDFWTREIAFYLDGVGFAHKTNPYGEARSTSTMSWRKRSEGLEMTTKGKKEGSGGKMANFFVGIAACGKGVVLCKQYTWKLNGENFAGFVERNFPEAFQKAGHDIDGGMFLQDGDPRQNCRLAVEKFDFLGCNVFHIPAKSPDLNPIENIFGLIRKQLRADALSQRITKETYGEFCKRCAATITNYSPEIINKTLSTMKKRIGMVIESKGNRIKY